MGDRSFRGPSLWLIVALGLACFCAPAMADKRIALVVGNTAYQNIPRLDLRSNLFGFRIARTLLAR